MQTQTLEEEIFDESVDQNINTKVSSKKYSIATLETGGKKLFSYTKIFQDFFGNKTKITDEFIEKQKDFFGFSLYILEEKSVLDALGIALDDSRIQRDKEMMNSSGILRKSFFTSAVILLAGMFILGIAGKWISPYAVLAFLLISQLPTYSLHLKGVIEKITHYKQSVLYFNIAKKEALNLNKRFFKIKESNGKNYSIGNSHVNNFGERQPFFYLGLFFISFSLYMKVTLDEGFDVNLLFILLAYISAYFRLLDKTIIFFLSIYFKIYFAIIDTYPLLFSPEDQERDFYLDIHKSGNALISDIAVLEELIVQFKNGTIDPKMGTYLTKILSQVTKLHALVEDRGHFLDGKEKFQDFLRNLFNEILEKYVESYSYLEKRIAAIEQGMDFQNLNEEERNTLKNHISPILQNNKEQLTYLKRALLDKRLVGSKDEIITNK